MAVRFEKPKTKGIQDMFKFWVSNLVQERPHLIVKHLNTNGKTAQIWYEIKKEIEYLNNLNLEYDARIQVLEKEDKDYKFFSAATTEIFRLKKEIQQNKQRLKELSKLPSEQKEKIINYNQFKEIITLFNKKASDYIVQGENLNLQNRLGYIQIRKIIPTIRSTSRIDWNESKKYKQELISKGEIPKDKENPDGKDWLIYINQPFYLRWAWVKRGKKSPACSVKNNKVYAFYPTASSSTTAEGGKVPGNKAKLSKAQLDNPLLHNKYTMVKLNGMDSKIIQPT